MGEKNGSTELLAPELMARVRTIQLRTHKLVSSALAGAYRSNFRGTGIEFESVRPYEPGDDVRTIDWKVTARVGEPFIKTYVEDRTLILQLVVDTSRWEPDVLIDAKRGLPLGYGFPRSGTVVIDDAIALVRGARHPDAARQFIDWVGEPRALLLAAREVFRLPARRDLPTDSLPAWVAEVEATMVEADMDWRLLAREGAGWMAYWDRRVRNTGSR